LPKRLFALHFSKRGENRFYVVNFIIAAKHFTDYVFDSGKIHNAADRAAGNSDHDLAADLGDPRSSYLKGLLLCEGRGVKVDPTAGLKWMEKASSMGNPVATARLAQAHYFGEFGLKSDHAKALPLLQKAATAGDPWACLALGQMYFRGQEVTKDDTTATIWFKKGADGGNPDAICEYGTSILKTNPAVAYPWLKCAILRDTTISNAKGTLMECRTALTAEEVSKGDQAAVELDNRLPKNSTR